jgi:tetratricopeptide (TPR) repeat protein
LVSHQPSTSGLVGRGEALLALNRDADALAAFSSALALDPSLTDLARRVEVLKFRSVEQGVARARDAARAGRFDDAVQAYLAAITSSPDSPFLYRELASVERRAGDTAAALTHAQKAAELDPNDSRSLVLIGEIYESQNDYTKAADAYTAAIAVEPNEALAAKIEDLRERAAFEAMPEEYKSIEAAPAITRAQLAALLGVRLEDLLRRARASSAVVLTDTRNNWAAPWIMSVTRAGVMDAYPNHTFQPSNPVRRVDLAQAVSRVLTLIAAEKPRLAAKWRDPRPRFPDMSPSHLSYPAAARAISSGVMTTLDGGAFGLTRPVSGVEAVAAVSRLEALARSSAR